LLGLRLGVFLSHNHLHDPGICLLLRPNPLDSFGPLLRPKGARSDGVNPFKTGVPQMPVFKLKPSHAPVKAYYETLARFGQGCHDNEGNIHSLRETPHH
jgi:hypothetical protein